MKEKVFVALCAIAPFAGAAVGAMAARYISERIAYAKAKQELKDSLAFAKETIKRRKENKND